jgi:hypothetical protein
MKDNANKNSECKWRKHEHFFLVIIEYGWYRSIVNVSVKCDVI